MDAIFIDPPYNTGDKNWKYNNDYVERSDRYRHSKWLAFMERRLKLAKKLLNPKGSVLIVTIDEKEYLRLGLLLEQTFPEVKGSEAKMQMISSVVNGAGRRTSEFGRVNEYIFFLWFGDMNLKGTIEKQSNSVRWNSLCRSNSRKERKNQFYPIYVNKKSGLIEAIGEPLSASTPRNKAPQRDDCISVFPIRERDGEELMWNKTPASLRELVTKGYVKIGKHRPKAKQPYPITYLQKSRVEEIENGEIEVVGRNQHDDSVVVRYREPKGSAPTTQWYLPLHRTSTSGTDLLRGFVPSSDFPSPKSLYAVEDCLLLFIKDRPKAVVVDFFAGSGTTCHAVMKLNRRYGGTRQCISVTNNEIGKEKEKALTKKGLRPGDPEWDKYGICDSVTIPRIKAAICGKTADGSPVKGNYKIMKVTSSENGEEKWQPADDFPMSDGLSENATFFNLTYEEPSMVEQDLAFTRIAPMLWMRAGARGRRICSWPDSGYRISDTYALIVDLDMSAKFISEVNNNTSIETIFAVTDSEDRFRVLANSLANRIEAVCLWKSYVSNFRKRS